MTNFSELAALLENGLAYSKQLKSILLDERQLIESRALENLPLILNEKADLLTSLELAHNHISEWLTKHQYPHLLTEFSHRAASEFKPTEDSPTQDSIHIELCLSVWAEFDACKVDCNESNKVNGIIIANSRKRTSERLDILKGHDSKQKLYGSNGLKTGSEGKGNPQTA